MMHLVELRAEELNGDDTALDDAMRTLWSELSAAGVSAEAGTQKAPSNAKSATSGVIHSLTIALSSGGAVALIKVLRDWLTRHRDLKIRVKSGASLVEISGASVQDVAAL